MLLTLLKYNNFYLFFLNLLEVNHVSRLTGLALMSIERDVWRSLDMEDISVAIAVAKAHKQQF